MVARTRTWLVLGAVGASALFASLAVAGWYLSARLEPMVRERLVAFLSSRFDGEVVLDDLEVAMPLRDPLGILLNKGRGARVTVTASGILLRQRGAREDYPLLQLRGLTFDFDASRLFDAPAVIDLVHIDGLELAIPPKDERAFTPGPRDPQRLGADGSNTPQVVIGRVVADGATLVILPKDPAKAPLRFDLHRLTLHSAGAGVPMPYVTTLRNPKPPGIVECRGTFGPYDTAEPGETPVSGHYTFRRADLAVFKGIAGLLDSSGRFGGTLNEIIVDGEATVADFRLPAAGNTVPLTTLFHAVVDGTNGDTRLDPVQARLGESPVTCRGGVVRYPGEFGKTVDLDCTARNARLDELLRLAVKGSPPPMTGRIDFDVKIVVPPEKVPYSEKLQLAGPFRLRDALFTNPTVQARLDDVSRRAQGEPSNMAIRAATSSFEGRMSFKQRVLTLHNLVFRIEGAQVRLAGRYDLRSDTVDFRGQVRTEARLSRMLKGWKRVLLVPVDPFFAKDGAGAQFHIAVTGPASSPTFGLDRRKAPEAGRPAAPRRAKPPGQ
jgi:hypothetical protein